MTSSWEFQRGNLRLNMTVNSKSSHDWGTTQVGVRGTMVDAKGYTAWARHDPTRAVLLGAYATQNLGSS